MKYKTSRAALAGLALALAGGGVSPAVAQDEPIKISIPSPVITGFCMGIRMARDPRLPDGVHNIDLKYENVTMPIPQVPVTVNNNDINVGECSGISTVINAYNKGAKNIIVFAFGSKLPVFQVVGRSDLESVADLKGAKIGIPGLQSAGAEAVEMSLKRGANLLPQRDYDFVQVGAGPSTMAALVAGKVDAVSFFPPLSFDLEDRGFKILADEVTYVPQYVTGTHLANKQWAAENRDRLVELLKAIILTGDWLKDPANEKEVVAWFSQEGIVYGDKALSPANAQKFYDFYIRDDRLAFDGYAPEGAVRANLDILKERGYITEEEIPPLGVVFDFSYLNQALEELGRAKVEEYSKN